MSWPYQFLDLDQAQKQARRHALDRYGLIAQLSALVPVALFLLYRLAAWGIARATGSDGGNYAAVPNSPVLKRHRLSTVGSWRSRARKLAWWFGDDVVLGWNWGPRDQIILGTAWTIWLLILCVVGTGKDYLHLTKRFGIVAVSQFPVQYLLSLKYLNPIALALRSSHEEVNRWHRVLGRVTGIFVTLHASFYFNFYYQNNLLGQKITSLVPVLGFILITAMYLLYGTALSVVRQYSYRLFFITHLLVALALPPVIYFHAHHASIYVWESLIVFLLDIATRRFGLITADTKVELIPGTDLIKLVGSIPRGKITRFAKNPGTHIYLSIPSASRPHRNPIAAAHLVFEFSFNPFSVAEVDENAGQLTLVARRHNGPMTRALTSFASHPSSDHNVKLSFDGPYGCAMRFPNLASSAFDRILFVAGGVGATFTLPLYRWVLAENPAARVQMVWAVRGAGDATWPVGGEGKGITDDDNIQLFLTGDILENTIDNARTSNESEDIEMVSLSNEDEQTKHALLYSDRRPNLQKIVDGFFRQGAEERVAVLVCGPDAMARDLRSHVGAWVNKGRDVWWHNESFAW
ncbi:ferric reductase like transmembrane component [Xylaria bambusicola]|uniref:ferric reductase like transmembrane component n=1 Tax=Xylaria bambusicola TaxID=326684 RepID=UPI002007D6FD|nr:ferric reductase like transmembrane component [Xylaria bambusicola]KAI0517852.1 ferric reductase like transmembrane component [Xylaria bambusicola]